MRILPKSLLLGFVLCCAGAMALGDGRRWVETHRWKANGSRQTEPFRIFGGRWRVTAVLPRRGDTRIECFDAATEKYVPLFPRRGRNAQDRSRRQTTLGNEGDGDRFLRIHSGQGEWTVVIEQRLDLGEQWLCRKDRAARLAPVQKLAAWSGRGARRLAFETPEPLWFLRLDPQGEGTLRIAVRDSRDEVLFSAGAKTPGQPAVGYFYAPGAYTIEVQGAEDIPWLIQAAQPPCKALARP